MRSDRFEQLYAEHAAPLFRFLAYRTGDRMTAEDILADTFERVLTARRRFDPRRGSEKTWIYSIAMNLVRDAARRRAAELKAVDRVGAHIGTEPPAELGSVEDREALAGAMRRLSDDEREAVSLRYGSDLQLEEIAKVIGQPRSTVEARIYRALGKLRGELEGQ